MAVLWDAVAFMVLPRETILLIEAFTHKHTWNIPNYKTLETHLKKMDAIHSMLMYIVIELSGTHFTNEKKNIFRENDFINFTSETNQ